MQAALPDVHEEIPVVTLAAVTASLAATDRYSELGIMEA